MKNTQKKEFEKTRNFQFSAKKYFEVPMDAFSQKFSSNLPTNLNMWIKVVLKIFETEKLVCNVSPVSRMWIQYKTASKPIPVLQSKQNQGQLPSTKCKGLRNHQTTSQMAHLSPSFSKNCLPTIVPSNLQKLDSALWWLFISVWTQKEAAWHEGSLTRNQTNDLFPGDPSISKQSIRKLA